ncbi:MAG: SRPBCC family protein [Polyangiales bacterium]
MDDTRTSDEPSVGKTSMQLVDPSEVVISRAFRASPKSVFEAWTQPEFVRRWWAPAALGVTMLECEADVRAGGAYRYVISARGGAPMVFSGTYIEVIPHERLVYLQVFEPMADAGAVTVTVRFVARDGLTIVESRERYPSPEARDAALASGMETGLRITMDQLDALLQTV